MALKEPKFHKGELILTECGFPAFVYENQIAKGYISIYAFGLEAEHGSEYPEKAVRINKELFYLKCANYGYTKDFVDQKAKDFKVEFIE